MASVLHSAARRPEFFPLSIIRALWKRKWFILALASVGTGTTVAVVSRLQPSYTAEALILVESQMIPERFVAATVQTALEARLDRLQQQVLSRDRLWNVVEALDLYQQERRRLTKEEVVQVMRQDIRINLVRGWSSRGPGAFRVEYAAPKPNTAAQVANQIGMFFVNENLRQRTVEAVNTSEFLDVQLREAETRLRQQEAKLQEFKRAYNGELPQQEGALLMGMTQSRTELLGIQEGLGRAQQNKLILENQLANVQEDLRERQQLPRRQTARSTTARNEGTRSARPLAPTELEDARSQLKRLRTRYHESHPEVQRTVLEVQRLEGEEAALRAAANGPQPTPIGDSRESAGSLEAPTAPTQDEVSRSAGNRIEQLRAQITLLTQEIESLESRRQRVIGEVAETQKRILNIPVREQQLSAITRDYETSKSNYESLLNKKLAADVATDMERWEKSQRLVMLDAARIPQRPSRPRRTLLTAFGTLLSWVTALGVAFLLEVRKNALLGEWELPADATVLGRIPRLEIESL